MSDSSFGSSSGLNALLASEKMDWLFPPVITSVAVLMRNGLSFYFTFLLILLNLCILFREGHASSLSVPAPNQSKMTVWSGLATCLKSLVELMETKERLKALKDSKGKKSSSEGPQKYWGRPGEPTENHVIADYKTAGKTGRAI